MSAVHAAERCAQEIRRLRKLVGERDAYIADLERYNYALQSEVRALSTSFVDSYCAPRKRRRRLAPIPSAPPLRADAVLGQPGPGTPQLVDALGEMGRSEVAATLCDSLAASLAADHPATAPRVAHALDMVCRASESRISVSLARTLVAVAVCGPRSDAATELQPAAAAAAAGGGNDDDDPVALSWAAFAAALCVLWRKSAGEHVVRVVLIEFLCHSLPRLGRWRAGGGAVPQRDCIRAALCACSLATLAAPGALRDNDSESGSAAVAAGPDPLRVLLESCASAIAADRARASSSLLRALVDAVVSRGAGGAAPHADQEWRRRLLTGLSGGAGSSGGAADPSRAVTAAMEAMRGATTGAARCSFALVTVHAFLAARAQPERARACATTGCGGCSAAHALLRAAQAVEVCAAALGWVWARDAVVGRALGKLAEAEAEAEFRAALLRVLGAWGHPAQHCALTQTPTPSLRRDPVRIGAHAGQQISSGSGGSLETQRGGGCGLDGCHRPARTRNGGAVRASSATCVTRPARTMPGSSSSSPAPACQRCAHSGTSPSRWTLYSVMRP